MIHMEDINWAVRELDRMIAADMCCVMINTDTRPSWLNYQDKHYDPFWARAEETGMPVLIHIVCGNKRDFFTLYGDERKDAMRMSLELYAEGPIVLANESIFGGILDRFPNLKLVLGEFKVSWLPNWLYVSSRWRANMGKDRSQHAETTDPRVHEPRLPGHHRRSLHR